MARSRCRGTPGGRHPAVPMSPASNHAFASLNRVLGQTSTSTAPSCGPGRCSAPSRASPTQAPARRPPSSPSLLAEVVGVGSGEGFPTGKGMFPSAGSKKGHRARRPWSACRPPARPWRPSWPGSTISRQPGQRRSRRVADHEHGPRCRVQSPARPRLVVQGRISGWRLDRKGHGDQVRGPLPKDRSALRPTPNRRATGPTTTRCPRFSPSSGAPGVRWLQTIR